MFSCYCYQPMIYKKWTKEKLTLLLVFWLISFSGIAQYSEPVSSDSVAPQLARRKWTQTTLYRTVAAPTLLVTAGLLTFNDNRVFDKYDVQRERQELIPNFRIRADDYLAVAPIAVVYGLDVLGVKARHNFVNRSLRLLTAEVLSQAIVIPMKKGTHIERPDGSDFRSFPSGHTTQAFVSATFVHKELGSLSPWYSIGAYTTATAVGALRIMNNKHWLSDVLVGAGIGILSTNVAYLIFPEGGPQRERNTTITITPSYYAGTVGFNMLLTLH